MFKPYLPKNPVIIDCGAHMGTDSIELHKIFPGAYIHSFEPVPVIFDKLCQKTKPYKNIFTYNLALSNKDESTKMFVSSSGSDGSSSLLAPKTHLQDHPAVLFNEVIEINTKKLDTWAEEHNIDRVDFLWLDMQGFEYQMLFASHKILPTVKVIHTEVSLKETYEGVLIYPLFKKWLEEHGFIVIKEMIPEGTDMGNVVFVRKNS